MFSLRKSARCFVLIAAVFAAPVIAAESGRLALCVVPEAAHTEISHRAPLPGRSPLHYRDDVYVINYFAPGKADITPYSADILERSAADLAQLARAHSAFIIEVAGFADVATDGAKAQELALRRAEMVRAFMVARGVPPAQVVLARRDATTPVSGKSVLKRRVETRVQRRTAPFSQPL